MSNLCWMLTVPAILAGTAFGWQAQRAEVKLPPPFATPSSNNRPQVAPRPSGAQLHVPDGFTVTEYASGFDKPRTMIYAPGGEILITESVSNGSVVVMTDKNGKPLEKRRKLIEGLDRPYGMAWWKDYLYVAETTSVKRYKFNATNATVGKGEEIIRMHDFGRGHWTRTIAFDPKGEKLY
jgi:glucose/arabinose dehydrogenase